MRGEKERKKNILLSRDGKTNKKMLNKTLQKNIKKQSLLVKLKVASSTVVESLTHNPEVEGSSLW
jgi:hypothetical protein